MPQRPEFPDCFLLLSCYLTQLAGRRAGRQAGQEESTCQLGPQREWWMGNWDSREPRSTDGGPTSLSTEEEAVGQGQRTPLNKESKPT